MCMVKWKHANQTINFQGSGAAEICDRLRVNILHSHIYIPHDSSFFSSALPENRKCAQVVVQAHGTVNNPARAAGRMIGMLLM